MQVLCCFLVKFCRRAVLSLELIALLNFPQTVGYLHWKSVTKMFNRIDIQIFECHKFVTIRSTRNARYLFCRSVSNARRQRQSMKIFIMHEKNHHHLSGRTFGRCSHTSDNVFACSSMDAHCCEYWSPIL